MLRQLALNGCEIAVIDATVFDAERATSVQPLHRRQRLAVSYILEPDDPPVRHRFHMTNRSLRKLMTMFEESRGDESCYSISKANWHHLRVYGFSVRPFLEYWNVCARYVFGISAFMGMTNLVWNYRSAPGTVLSGCVWRRNLRTHGRC